MKSVWISAVVCAGISGIAGGAWVLPATQEAIDLRDRRGTVRCRIGLLDQDQHVAGMELYSPSGRVMARLISNEEGAQLCLGGSQGYDVVLSSQGEGLTLRMGSAAGGIVASVDASGHARIVCHGGADGGRVELASADDSASVKVLCSGSGGSTVVSATSTGDAAVISLDDGSGAGVVIESKRGVGDALRMGGFGNGARLVVDREGGANLELSGGRGGVSLSSSSMGSGIAVSDTDGRPRVLLGVSAKDVAEERVIDEHGNEIK